MPFPWHTEQIFFGDFCRVRDTFRRLWFADLPKNRVHHAVTWPCHARWAGFYAVARLGKPQPAKRGHGRGKIPEKICSVCHGKGIERRTQQIKLKIPAGIDDGAAIRLTARGQAVQGGEKGDLYVNIRVKPHKDFTREGDLIFVARDG